MIIDCHAHFEPRMLELDQTVRKMDEQGIDKVAFIASLNDPIPDTPERLLALTRAGMQRRATRPLTELIHRLTIAKPGELRVGLRSYAIYAQPDNDAVATAIAAHPGRLLGWIFLNPKCEADPLEELERCRERPGFIGVKLHPHWHDYRTDVLDPVLRRCEELGLAVLIHLGFRGRGDFRSMAARFPKLTIISAHAGFPFYRDLWHYRRAYPNLYVDLSSPYIDEPLARAAVAAMGPERCLYGTDAPYGAHGADGSYDYGSIKGWVERLPVPSAKREAIFGSTFAALIARHL